MSNYQASYRRNAYVKKNKVPKSKSEYNRKYYEKKRKQRQQQQSFSLETSIAMKRANEDDEEEEGAPAKRQNVERDIERETLEQMKSYLRADDGYYNEEVNQATQKYYMEYFKKMLKEIPLCKDIFNMENLGDDFQKIYTIAKSVINFNIQIKKYMAMSSLANATSSIIGQLFHQRYIVPLLSKTVDVETLKEAFSEYQKEIAKDSEPDRTQCVSYLIQSQLEDQQPLKVPHPLVNCVTTQITASSKYAIKVLSNFARTFIKDTIPVMDDIELA